MIVEFIKPKALKDATNLPMFIEAHGGGAVFLD
jgi:hypothetical protein